MGIAAACSIIILFVAVISPSIFGSFFDLIYGSLFEKVGSSSGVERAYWNSRSLDAFVATYGLGIGIGSSRASSWVVAVLSQLGIVGFALITVLTIVIIRGMHGVGKGRSENEVAAIANAVRAAAIAGLVANSLIGGGADPGLIFIIAVAVIIQSRTITSRWAGAASSPSPADTHFGSGAITVAG